MWRDVSTHNQSYCNTGLLSHGFKREEIYTHKHTDLYPNRRDKWPPGPRRVPSRRSVRPHPNCDSLSLGGGVHLARLLPPSSRNLLHPSFLWMWRCSRALGPQQELVTFIFILFSLSQPQASPLSLNETLLHLYFCIFLYYYGCFHPLFFCTFNGLRTSEREAPHASPLHMLAPPSSCFSFLFFSCR